MKKSEIYSLAIAAVIDNENIDMEIKIEMLREMLDKLDVEVYSEERDAAEGKA